MSTKCLSCDNRYRLFDIVLHVLVMWGRQLNSSSMIMPGRERETGAGKSFGIICLKLDFCGCFSVQFGYSKENQGLLSLVLK